MEGISNAICMGILIYLSVEDVRKRKIPLVILMVGGCMAFTYQLMWGMEDIWETAAGAGIGLCFLVVGWLTGEKIGYGDGIAIMMLGIYLGIWKLLEILAGAFFLLAMAGMICLTGKRFSRKQTLPFCPFLTAGYVICLLCKGG